MSKQTAKQQPTPTTLDALIPDDHNANKGTERGTGFLENSLRKFGAGRSIIVDKHNRIIAGNKTHQQALELGMKAKVVETDGDTLVVVKRNDIDLDSPEGREMAIADNRVGQVNLAWDHGELTSFKDEGVKVDDWFFEGELTELAPEKIGEIDGFFKDDGHHGAAKQKEQEDGVCSKCGQALPKAEPKQEPEVKA